MARNALLTLALAATLSLTGCVAKALYGKPDTALVVVNNSSDPITVAYEQSPENTDSSVVATEQSVTPGYSTRYFGVVGDTLSVHAGDRPAFTVEYSDRSQVIEVTDEGVTLRKDFNEPKRDEG